MCHNFYAIRSFGAVMSAEVNCGQVRGPVQLSFARSVDPIVTQEHAITRNSVTNERDLAKKRTMGRKFTVPYGLYRAHGFIYPFLAEQTGFGDETLTCCGAPWKERSGVDVPRAFSDHEVLIDKDAIPKGVSVRNRS